MERPTVKPPVPMKLPLKENNIGMTASLIKEGYTKRIPEKGVECMDSNEKNYKYDKERPYVNRKSKQEIEEYVGFANLPNQVYRKAVKKGFDFTLMVVGASGLGKSTLLNTMFLTDIYGPDYLGPSLRNRKTTQVETTKCLLKENGVNLTLTVVDTPGFGDAVDNSNCWEPILNYIESRFEEFLDGESRVKRTNDALLDNRVHCCLYFIAPTGHGLKPLDLEFMKQLHDKVNIIPIIAKADTLTPEECSAFKKIVMDGINEQKIKIYEFPQIEDEEGTLKKLRDRVPMAVVGSNTIIEADGKRLRGRRYPWGVAEVENLEHCDFLALRNMVIKSHMQDLKDVTHEVLYENYRSKKLSLFNVGDGNKGKIANKNPLALIEEERKEQEAKLKKMEQEMEQVFEIKVKEKMQKLQDSEEDLQKRHEKMRESLEMQIKELEEKRKALEAEKSLWEQSNGVSLEELRRRSLEREAEGKEKKNKKKGLF